MQLNMDKSSRWGPHQSDQRTDCLWLYLTVIACMCEGRSRREMAAGFRETFDVFVEGIPPRSVVIVLEIAARCGGEIHLYSWG